MLMNLDYTINAAREPWQDFKLERKILTSKLSPPDSRFIKLEIFRGNENFMLNFKFDTIYVVSSMVRFICYCSSWNN